jgi:rod shape determining protein RodA
MNKSIIFRLDWMLLLVYLVLVSFGIVNIYSATFSETSGGLFDLTQAVGKQVFFLVFSLFTGIIILAINSKFFEQFASLGYFISILLLVGLFVFGKTVSGATSWYNIGGISFQPSELAKVTTALIIASLLSKFQSDIKTPRTLFKIGAYVLLPFLLIVVQPDPRISSGIWRFLFSIIQRRTQLFLFDHFPLCIISIFCHPQFSLWCGRRNHHHVDLLTLLHF